MVEIVGRRVRIIGCENCDSVIKFNYEDIRKEMAAGYQFGYVKCPCCGKDIMVIKKSDNIYTSAIEVNKWGDNLRFRG